MFDHGRRAVDKLLYSPLAKAARVEGVVVSRVIYNPAGGVEGFEAVFGPPMLSKYLEHEIAKWNVETDAKGDRLCETLIIARFRLKDPISCDPAPDAPTEYDFSTPSIFRMNLGASGYLTCDPAATIISPSPARLIFYKLKHGLSRIFRGQEPFVPML